MMKIDYKKVWKHLYNPSIKEITVVDVPDMNYLMIDGEGDPNANRDYAAAIEALYTVSYTLKFMIKKGDLATDYVVMPLEGLWWLEDMSQFSEDDKDPWLWTMMIGQPEYVTRELFEEAMQLVEKKKNPSALKKVRMELFNEGQAAQIMYIGPYAYEGPTIKRIHDFIVHRGGQLTGKHHEIYLSDPRKTAQGKLKTIIRQPFSK